MFFHPKNLKSENKNPGFKPGFNILLHTQSIVGATVDSHCLEYLGYITLFSLSKIKDDLIHDEFFMNKRKLSAIHSMKKSITFCANLVSSD